MAPRWQRLDGFVLVFRSAAAVTIETGIVGESAVMGDDKARVSGPVIPRVTVRRHRSRIRPTDMQAFISSNVAISSSNCIWCVQQVVSGTASRAGTGRLMRPHQGHTPSFSLYKKPSAHSNMHQCIQVSRDKDDRTGCRDVRTHLLLGRRRTRRRPFPERGARGSAVQSLIRRLADPVERYILRSLLTGNGRSRV